MYDVQLEVEVEEALQVGGLVELAAEVMAGEGVAEGTGLSVLITGDDEIRALNQEFLGIDEPTDVLSFPDAGDDFVEGEVGPAMLGDIAISLPTAARQAEANEISIELELAHLLVHGILHLCGWDHVESPEAEAAMRAREEYYVPGVKHSQAH